jgi:hypothetical protein
VCGAETGAEASSEAGLLGLIGSQCLVLVRVRLLSIVPFLLLLVKVWECNRTWNGFGHGEEVWTRGVSVEIGDRVCVGCRRRSRRVVAAGFRWGSSLG